MIKNRFLCKTNEQGITTIFVVVVMLLLFTASCNGDNKEVVVVAFDPETTYTLRTTDYTTQFSDSGITRYRAIAKEFLKFDKAKEPFSYFPEGIYVENSILYLILKRVLKRIRLIIMRRKDYGS